MNEREFKAQAIAAHSRLTFKDGVWTVPSQSGQPPYRVQLLREGATCTCDDWLIRKQDCKHIIAAQFVAKREMATEIASPEIESLPPKKKYAQNWRVYNQAQITEKRRFQILLADLCRGVQQPPYLGGRPRSPIADVIFACVFKVYSAISSRRFGSDLLDAAEKGFLSKPMHPNRINALLEDPNLTPIFRKLVTTSSLPLAPIEREFAPDSTGFSVSRFVRWFDEKYGMNRSGHDWVKVHGMVGSKTHIVTAIEIEERSAGDCPFFKPLVEATAQNFKIDQVAADKAYLSKENLELVAALGGTAFIPFKPNNVPGEEGSVWYKMFHYYQSRRDEFLNHYHRRSNAESVFSMVKAKFGDNVRSRSDAAMRNEAFCKFICHNICVIHQSQIELGIEPEFWPKEDKGGAPKLQAS